MTITPLVNSILSHFDISDSEIELLTHYFKIEKYTKGSILEKEDNVAQNLYFILNGFVRSYLNEDGTELTTQIIEKNNFITAFKSFVSGVVSKETIQCISDCQMLYITKPDYVALTKKSAIWNTFCKLVYEKNISFNQQRIKDLLVLSAEKRYIKLLSERPEIIQNVPVQYIASYIGIKPESLSRIRKKVIS